MPGHFKAVVALSIALSANHVYAQITGRLTPGTGIITGTIQMDGGGSVAGVRVAVISVDDSIGANLISLSESDASGHFRLTDVPQGHYYVVAGRVTVPIIDTFELVEIEHEEGVLASSFLRPQIGKPSQHRAPVRQIGQRITHSQFPQLAHFAVDLRALGEI